MTIFLHYSCELLNSIICDAPVYFGEKHLAINGENQDFT